ncbi:MAG TPA: cation:proton antiporter [Patescibacteria group bacterium]|nr:cation:proton antiporter [Patescibacteria group bacterium]
MGNILFELTVIISIAAILSILLRLIKQPPILAYILTGILIGPFGNFQLQSRDFLQALGELGIALLLFIVGLELNFNEVKSVSKVAAVVGTLQVTLTAMGGYFISKALGFNNVESIYLAAAVAFSSTIIVVKLLTDIKAMQNLNGKISFGLLLVQDLFAVFVLIFLSSFFKSALSLGSLASVFVPGLIIVLTTLFLSVFVFPKLIAKIGNSYETLFLFAIAWVLGLSALMSSVGFSIEIGGLLAGLSLANTTGTLHIIDRTKPLRDFFITLFFVILGLNMSFISLSKIFIPAVILSLFVILFKPFVTFIVMRIMGFPKKVSALTGISLGQISEFSLIIIFIGQKLGHVSPEIVSLVATVAILTFAVSSYLIMGSERLTRSLD